MIGSILGGFGSFLGGIGSMIGGFSEKASSERIAEMNLAFQQEQFEYLKALNQLQMEREDSTYQRTVNDMRQAGMSPLAMQSTNSAGSLSAGTAPQREQNDYSGILNSLYSITSQFSQLGQVMSGIRRTDAETNFINAQAEKVKQDTLFDLDTYDHRKTKLKYDSAQSFVDSSQKYFDLQANGYYGFSSGMPDDIKRHLFSMATGWIDINRDNLIPRWHENNQYNDIYNRENSLRWQNIEADTKLKEKDLDWKDYEKIMGAFGSLLGAFSSGM